MSSFEGEKGNLLDKQVYFSPGIIQTGVKSQVGSGEGGGSLAEEWESSYQMTSVI